MLNIPNPYKMQTRTLILASLLAIGTFAPAQVVHRYWVAFTDKVGTPCTINNPSEYLSQRALDRRVRMHIGIDSLDLPVNPAYTEALRQTGGIVWTVSKWLNGAVFYAADSSGMESTLWALPFVASVEYYGQGSLQRGEVEEWFFGHPATAQTCDTLFGPDYYGLGHYNINTMNGIPLHRGGYQGEGVLVGVCDVGFPGVDTLEAFATLRDEGRLVATRDFVYGGNHVFDVHSHGTRVLSNMAAYLPGIYVGTAPRASYILCRTEDVGGESPLEEYFWAAAMEYLDSMGVDIVNTSLGYRYFDDDSRDHSPATLDGRTAPMTRAANAASSRGILVVVAAGNEGYDPAPNIGVPADSPAALTVGAIDHEGLRALFSSFGPTADGRIKPDVMSPGESVWVVNPDGSVQQVNGTSFASPILAGLAACMMQRHPTLGPAAWCDSLRAWGSLATNPDNENGYGVPDMGLALRDTQEVNLIAVDGNVLRLHPNPATDYVRLPLEGSAASSRIELYDATGRRLFLLISPAPHLDLSTLPRGTYLLRLITPTTTRTARLVKL